MREKNNKKIIIIILLMLLLILLPCKVQADALGSVTFQFVSHHFVPLAMGNGVYLFCAEFGARLSNPTVNLGTMYLGTTLSSSRANYIARQGELRERKSDGITTWHYENRQYVGSTPIEVNGDSPISYIASALPQEECDAIQYKSYWQDYDPKTDTIPEYDTRTEITYPDIILNDSLWDYNKNKQKSLVGTTTLKNEIAIATYLKDSTSRRVEMSKDVICTSNNLYTSIKILGNIFTRGQLGSTMDVNLVGPITLNGIDSSQYTVYYSTNANANINNINEWTTSPSSYSDIKLFFIKMNDNYNMSKFGNVFNIRYELEIPNYKEWYEKYGYAYQDYLGNLHYPADSDFSKYESAYAENLKNGYNYDEDFYYFRHYYGHDYGNKYVGYLKKVTFTAESYNQFTVYYSKDGNIGQSITSEKLGIKVVEQGEETNVKEDDISAKEDETTATLNDLKGEKTNGITYRGGQAVVDNPETKDISNKPECTGEINRVNGVDYNDNAATGLCRCTVNNTDKIQGNHNRTISDKATKYTVQTALWCCRNYNKGTGTFDYDGNGVALYNEATDYVNFRKNYLEDFSSHVNIDFTNAQVIAQQDSSKDSNDGYYILGPYKINYPDDSRFSYMNDLYLTYTDKDGISKEYHVCTETTKNDGTMIKRYLPYTSYKNGENKEVKENVSDYFENEIIRDNMNSPFPHSENSFYIKVKAKDIGYTKDVKIGVRFNYLKDTYAKYEYFYGTMDAVNYNSRIDAIYIPGDKDSPGYYIYNVYLDPSRTKIHIQTLAEVLKASRTFVIYEQNSDKNIDLSMDVGGKVWEDSKQGKESENNGLYDTQSQEKLMPNVKVQLYKYYYGDENNYIGETKTDKDGYYEFKGLNSMYKYYVKFTYNGQYYQPTKYWQNGESNWEINSKAMDISSERDSYNNGFEEIGSSPHNYESSNSKGWLQESQDGKYYNKTFSKKYLLGYRQDSTGKYGDTPTATPVIDQFGNLIVTSDDGHTFIPWDYANRTRKNADGKENKDWSKVEQPIALKGGVTEIEMQQMIQYVLDCRTDAYTCNGTNGINKSNNLNSGIQYYPLVNRFVVANKLNNVEVSTGVLDPKNETYSLYKETKNEGDKNKTDQPSPNQYCINLGLSARETADLALRKDVYQVNLEINNKKETYTYNKRQSLTARKNADGTESEYWDIETRLSDVEANYYGYNYSRELYREDYDYNVDVYGNRKDSINVANVDAAVSAGKTNTDNELKIYVTYKIDIRNQSGTLNTILTELVDYYDSDYKLIGSDNNNEKEKGYKPYYTNADKVGNLTTKSESRYGKETQGNIDKYNTVYVTGESEKSDITTINSNSDIYMYLTFIVNKHNDNKQDKRNILDESLKTGIADGVGKENIAEVNGYKTYYSDKAKAPNGSEYSKDNVAGIVDIDSNPGNVTEHPETSNLTIVKDKQTDYSKFEDDTDKAPNIRIVLNRTNVRTIDGIVWDDQRTANCENAQIGDGEKGKDEIGKDEIGVNGVRVQLVELYNDKEYVWKEFKTGPHGGLEPIINNSELISTYDVDVAGEYKFESFVPGDYIVRFIYGSDDDTSLGKEASDYNNGNTIDNQVINQLTLNGELDKRTLNKKSYNGQDYKSTVYQKYTKNTDAANNTETGTYNYSFNDADGKNESDAKDIMSRRKKVEKYSSENVTNDTAEILASFEKLPSDESTLRNKLNTFEDNTAMTAETGKINVNFEYNRTGTESTKDKIQYTNTKDSEKPEESGNNNISLDDNYKTCGYYYLNGLDFGLQERPKAQLKTTKQVVNVKVTLANGTALFDATQKATNVLWIGHTAHKTDITNTYSTKENYKTNLMNTPIPRQNASDKGKIQLTMDSELMHGAKMQITYAIFVANVGEVDYKDNEFYYLGTEKDPTSNIVKTTANELVDYIGYQSGSSNTKDTTATRNNLKFNASENPDWIVITADNLESQGLVNEKLDEEIKKYNTIIVTRGNASISSKALIPIIADQNSADENSAKTIKETLNNNPLNAVNVANNTASVAATQLILSQTISSENKSDDMTYNNMVEIVKTSNTVGRRMAYSVVGNQSPTLEPSEIDADDSQEIVILPPFGQRKSTYYALGAIVIIVLATGIIFIKKKVL